MSRENKNIKFSLMSGQDRERERERRIAWTAFFSVIQKVLTMAIPLITLKITYDYLNDEVYGLWSAATTFFALFSFSDLGLGNGLQTKLSQAYGKDDIPLCQKIISNTFILLLCIAIILSLLFVLLFPHIDWATLMNANSDETIVLASSVIFVIVIPKIFSIPIAIIERTQLALQEGYKTHIWNIFGAIFNMCCIILISKFDLGKITLLIVSTCIPIVFSFLNMISYFYISHKNLIFSFHLFDKQLVKQLLSLGISFCVLSLLMTIGMSMDTFIVARSYSLSEAASYSIIYKIAAMSSSVITIFSIPLWGANGEAISRGDWNWVKKNTQKISHTMTILSITISVILLLSSNFIFKIWLGDSFIFSKSAFLWLLLNQVILSYISPYFMVLNACGDMKIQILLFLCYTPLVFLLKILLSKYCGIFIIPLIGTVLYFIFIVLGIRIIINKRYKFS